MMPKKRNENLVELSRDPHHGLGWKIKRGLKRKVDIEELTKYCIYFAIEALFPHFAEEENQVLIHLPPDDEYRKRTIDEHREIISLIDSLEIPGFADEVLLLKLANKVDAHVRFEEAELFPYMNTCLPAEQLDEICKLISELHQPVLEIYSNEFWAN